MKSVVSVAICSYERYDLLHGALDSLVRAGLSSDDFFQIWVIENTPANRRERFTVPQNVKVAVCDQVGLSAARNKAMEVSDDDYIVFLDDDIVMSEAWPLAVKMVVAEGKIRAFGGRVTPGYPCPLPSWFYRELEGYLSCVDWPADSVRPLASGEWIVGANMGFLLSDLRKFGGFDLKLGRIGSGSLLSNEEIALFSKFGHSNIHYVPLMHVRHLIPESRLDQAWFRRRAFWQGVSDVLAGTVWMSPDAAMGYLRDCAVKFPAAQRTPVMCLESVEEPQQFEAQMKATLAMAVLMASSGLKP